MRRYGVSRACSGYPLEEALVHAVSLDDPDRFECGGRWQVFATCLSFVPTDLFCRSCQSRIIAKRVGEGRAGEVGRYYRDHGESMYIQRRKRDPAPYPETERSIDDGLTRRYRRHTPPCEKVYMDNGNKDEDDEVSD